MNPKVVDRFLDRAKKWKEEMTLLRNICLDCGLTEDFKWMHPCYTYKEKNVVLINGFKAYCALLFHKGVLLKDSENMLVQQTKNVQAARQLRFTSAEEIKTLEATIKAYIFEAIELEKAGLEVKMKKTSEYDMPEELLLKFKKDLSFKTAFEALTPGRQRGYLLHFSQAKQSKTRIARIEKSILKIFDGKGLNDR
jgi:uncharacterized protein YdeI (YjbR/CyaY-like superfamily)